MILTIDASNIGSGGGINYIVELLKNADPKAHGFKKVIIWGNKPLLTQLPKSDWLQKRTHKFLNKNILFRVLWQTFIRDGEIKKAGADILFLPNSSISNFRPQVSMCQNQLPFEEKEMELYKGITAYFRLKLLRWQHERSYRNADGIIFLSEYSLNGVARAITSIQEKSTIITHGININFFNRSRQNKGPEILELVYVSIIDVYKHQWNVAQAVINLVNKGFKNVRLTLVGGCFRPAKEKLDAILKAHPELSEYINYKGKVDYNDLPALYAKADIGVFASSCETFGMILLEKMATGMAIASSSRAAAPEIAQDTVVYFDPYQVESIEKSLLELIQSPEKRQKLGLAAQERAKNFSWQKCANQTFEYLSKVAKSGK